MEYNKENVENFIIGFNKIAKNFFNIEIVDEISKKGMLCFEIKQNSRKYIGTDMDFTRDIQRFGKNQKIILIKNILEKIIELKDDIEVLECITEEKILAEKFHSRVMKPYDLHFKLEDNPDCKILFSNITFNNHLIIFDKENIMIDLILDVNNNENILSVNIGANICIEDINEIKIYKLENYIPSDLKKLFV
jgi:hypothetical protein